MTQFVHFVYLNLKIILTVVSVLQGLVYVHGIQ